MSKILISVCLFMAVLTGCTKTETTPPKDEIPEEKTLLIGLIPERNIIEQIKRYEPIAEYLSEKTGKNKIRETLLNMHNNQDGKKVLKQFGANRFIATRDDDYTSVYNYIKKIDLNLSTYDYMNE